jgi:hypothetical protein
MMEALRRRDSPFGVTFGGGIEKREMKGVFRTAMYSWIHGLKLPPLRVLKVFRVVGDYISIVPPRAAIVEA